MKPHQKINPSFKFNGLSYSSDELIAFTAELKDAGSQYEQEIANFLLDWFSDSDTLITNTSGSTGSPKQIQLEKSKMIASARATGAALGLGEKTEALLCLSTNFIAGKMMIVRALVLGWHLHAVAPSRNFLVEYDNKYDFVAMVPYQVLHSLEDLNKIKTLLVGGGPIPPALENKLQNVSTKVYASYGMTETITHVALRLVNGPDKAEAFTALPDVSFSQDNRGCLVIKAPYIFIAPIITNDVVRLQNNKQFIWEGRIDNVINSGGVKIHPEKIESKLASQIKVPFFVSSLADDSLGQKVILVMEAPSKNKESSGLDQSSFDLLETYERPKKIYTVSSFLYTDTGKVRRQEILRLIEKFKN
ncbi:MAG: AMP-binding protein [Gilvibacter sp.]